MEKADNNSKINLAIEILTKMNIVLEKYYSLTLKINNLLNDVNNEEENSVIIENIGVDLNQRELAIKEYNQLKFYYDEIRTLIDLSEVTELKKLEEARIEILRSIDTVDSDNKIKINLLYSKQQSELKKINEGKRMFNAYEGNHPLAYGVFIDKKK